MAISCGGRANILRRPSKEEEDPLPAPLKRGELKFKVFSFSNCKDTKFFADMQIIFPKKQAHLHIPILSLEQLGFDKYNKKTPSD